MKPNLSSIALFARNDAVSNRGVVVYENGAVFSIPQTQTGQAHVRQILLPFDQQLPDPILVPDPIHDRREGHLALNPCVAPEKHNVLRDFLAHSLYETHRRRRRRIVALLLLFFVFVFVKLSPTLRSSPPLAPRSLQDHEEEPVLAVVLARRNRREIEFRRDRNLPSLVAIRAFSSHSTTTGGEVGRELVRRYSDLPAQNRLEALELQRRVNEHAPDVALALSVEEDHRDGDAAGDLHHFRHYLRRDDVRFFR